MWWGRMKGLLWCHTVRLFPLWLKSPCHGSCFVLSGWWLTRRIWLIFGWCYDDFYVVRDFIPALVCVCACARACVMDTAGSVVDVIFGMSLFASTLFWMFHACLSSLALLLPQLNKSLCHLWLGLCLWKDTGIILYSCITQWTSNLSLPEGWGGWISIVVSVQVPAPKSVCSNMIPHRAHMTEKKRYHVKIYFCQFILICILWWYAT